MQRTRTRERWLVAATAALALGAAASPAAALELDVTTDTSLTLDSDIHYFNDVKPYTHGNYQYFIYWDAESPGIGDPAPVKVTRRNLTTNALEHTNFGGTYELGNTSDAHNTLRGGLSKIDGRIHIAWSDHNKPLEYVYSSAGCLSQARFSDCRWTYTNTMGDPANEASVTYPIFFDDSAGNLYMSYRNGSSVRGNQFLNKYDNDGTWTNIGRIMQGYQTTDDVTNRDTPGTYDPDPSDAYSASTARGPYLWGAQFDKNDRLHVLWSWKEANYNEFEAEGGALHGAYYAYSDDGGYVWRNNSGTTIADVSTGGHIDMNDSGVEVAAGVAGLGYNSWSSGYELELDSRNQPHGILPVSDTITADPLAISVRQRHVWRTTDGNWYAGWVEPATANPQTYAWGNLMFDRADNAYFIYNRNTLGWAPVNANPFRPRELRNDMVTWQDGDVLNIKQWSFQTEILTTDHVNTAISTRGNTQIRVRMRNTTDSNDVYFWWTTDASQGWSSSRSQAINDRIRTDGNWEDVTFTITDADWTGNLRQLLFAPTSDASADSGEEVEIDWIRITDSSGRVAKAWEFDDGVEVIAAEASATSNWNRWNIDTLLAGVSDTWNDAGFVIDRQRYADGDRDTRWVSFVTIDQGDPLVEELTLHEFDIREDVVMKAWNFDVDTQGWTSPGDVSGLRYESDGGNNALAGTITGSDPRVYSPTNLKLRIDADVIHVRMKNTSAARQARVYFTTDDDQTFDLTKSATFAITANSGYTDYQIDMRSVSGWAGETLRRVRIDPADDGTSSGSFKISRVYIAP